jgi:hypothetical protein
MTRPLRLLTLRTLLIAVLTVGQPHQRPGARTGPAFPFTCAQKVAEGHLSDQAPRVAQLDRPGGVALGGSPVGWSA